MQIPRNFGDQEGPNELADAFESAKILKIHNGAVWPLIPISYGGDDEPELDDAQLVELLKDFYADYDEQSPAWLDSRILRKYHYAINNTEISISDPVEDDGTYGSSQDITVTVRYTYRLSVPYAGWLFHTMDDSGVKLDGDRGYALVIPANCTLTNAGQQDSVNVERFETPN